MVGPELVANLVGHVVDEEGISHRVRGTGHACRFIRGAEYSQPRQPTAPGVHHVTDVEGTEPLGLRHGLHLHVDVDVAQARAGRVIPVEEGIRGRVGEDDGVVAAGQLELGCHVTLVHLVDPVEQGGNGAETGLHSPAVILGVLPRRRDGDDVALALVAIHQHLAGQLAGLAADDAIGLLFQPAVGILLVIDRITLAVAQGIDKHHPALVAEHGVETLGAEIDTPGFDRVCFVVSLEGPDPGVLGGKICRQQIIGLQAEGHLLAIRQRQGQSMLPSQQTGEVIGRYGGDAILAGSHLIAIGSGGLCRHRIPLTGGQAGGAHQTGHQQRQRRVFHQLHLFIPFSMRSPELPQHHFPATVRSPAPSAVHSPNGDGCTNAV